LGPVSLKKLGQHLFLFLLLIKFAAKHLPSFRGKKNCHQETID
jgi:hypothetical protein